MVIGIIALLIAILVPTLNRARQTAKRIACLSNLRQMAVAAQAYVNDNRGHYPSAQFALNDGTTQYRYAWDFTLVAAPGLPVKVVPGLLWRSNDPLRVQQCPAFEGSANSKYDPYTGYNYNTTYVGHGQGEAVETPARASAVRRPSTAALFGDGQYAAGANKYMRAPRRTKADTLVGRYAGTQGYRHERLTNVAYCDGHAESVRDRFTDNDDGPALVASGTGFLSADNSAYSIE